MRLNSRSLALLAFAAEATFAVWLAGADSTHPFDATRVDAADIGAAWGDGAAQPGDRREPWIGLSPDVPCGARLALHSRTRDRAPSSAEPGYTASSAIGFSKTVVVLAGSCGDSAFVFDGELKTSVTRSVPVVLPSRCAEGQSPRVEVVAMDDAARLTDTVVDTRLTLIDPAPIVMTTFDRTLAPKGIGFVTDPERIAAPDFVRECAGRGLEVEISAHIPFEVGDIRQSIDLYENTRPE